MADMTDEDLLKILKEEERDSAAYYTSELAKDQAEAMERFYGNKYGDEVEGRSSITTHDIEDCINWIMPDLMRVFLASDELVTIEPGSQEDEMPFDGNPGSRPVKLAGPGNPIVGVQELRNSCSEQVQAMGYKDASRFFKEIPKDYQPPAPGPDPKVIEAQMKAQLQQQEQQANQQMQAQKLASERELAVFKAQSEQQLAMMRLEMEERLATQRMNMEASLDLRRQNMEATQAERDSQRSAQTTVIAAKENAKAKAKANGSGKTAIKKTRPGGDLSK